MRKKILLSFLVILILIQFIRPAENRSGSLSSNDITRRYPIPDTVLHILQRSCYDCHSNNTFYPWYNRIQPVAWYLQYHVDQGKWDLNFSEFGSYPAKKQAKKLKEITEQIKEDGMPLDSYLWIHGNARLTEGEKKQLMGWADSLKATIPAVMQ
ncbi:heme-binding domain-containing protein [Flavitalea flava]